MTISFDGGREMAVEARKAKVTRQLGVAVAACPWDLGPVTARQIAGKVVEEVKTVDPDTGKEANPNKVVRTRRESWVERYHRKGKLTDGQMSIAEELVEAASGQVQRDALTALLAVVDVSGREDPEVARIDRKRKFFAMWALVPGFARPVIQHTVLNDASLRSIPGGSSANREAVHLDRLRRGLDALHAAWGRKILTGPN